MKYKQIDHMASIATIYDNIKIITKKNQNASHLQASQTEK